MARTSEISIIGGGPVGVVAALYLAKRGFRVTIYEGRPDPRLTRAPGGRSINLTLAARGWKALADVGADGDVRKISLPLSGRFVHGEDGHQSSHLYGSHDECLHTVSRTHLTQALMSIAEPNPNIRLVFGHRLLTLEPKTGLLEFDRPEGGSALNIRARLLLAADGSHSAVRSSLLRHHSGDYFHAYSRFWYKELTIPKGDDWPLDPGFTHVWPRDDALLVAFPNTNRSFSATLFMPFEGPRSFSALRSRADLLALFESTFSDVPQLAPNLDYAFFARPIAPLLTIRCSPWVSSGKFALIGDAAHTMVPFLGQGMNAGFEDCTVLDGCIASCGEDWEAVLTEYERLRKPNCDAVTDLAERHYQELAVGLKDPTYAKRKRIEHRVHEMHPDHFVPLYTLVSFTRLPYTLASVVTARQDRLVDTLLAIEDVEERWETDAVRRAIREYVDATSPLALTDGLGLVRTEPPRGGPAEDPLAS